MGIEEYVELINEKLDDEVAKKILVNQLKNYFAALESKIIITHTYKVGDEVKLSKGTLLHGTYKNLEGLKEIAKSGLISSWFIDGRLSKYPSSVGVWNLKKDYLLKDYINFYSGGTILYSGIYLNGIDTQQNKTEVIPYDKMSNIIKITQENECYMWTMEQTKEARFMPSLVQNRVQIAIIYNGQSKEIKGLLNGDILSNSINDKNVKEFVNPTYYENFLKQRKCKDDFFTDRESAILFGIPSCFIEGILVGRNYEKDKNVLNEIKELLPNCYICNLDGKVIVE